MLNLDKYRNDLPFGATGSEERKAWKAHESKLQEAFYADALIEVGLKEHPKAAKAFSLAWQLGHASGHSDVMSHLYDIAELVKD